MDEPTEVMPLDQLMDLAGEPATMPIRRPPTTPTPATTSPSAPTSSAPAYEPAPPVLQERLHHEQSHHEPPPVVQEQPRQEGPPPVPTLHDLREDVGAAATQVHDWLQRGDNALITATIAIALILLIVIGAG